MSNIFTIFPLLYMIYMVTKNSFYFLVLLGLILLSCDEKEVRREYFENGTLQYEIEWSDGKKNGNAKEYYSNGNLLFEGNFKDDLGVGWHTFYYSNGTLDQKFFYTIVGTQHKWLRKMKYNKQGQLISDLRNVEKKLRISADKGSRYSVGDTMVLSVKIENPKYIYSEGLLGFFDEHLNSLKDLEKVQYIEGNAEHEVTFHILMRKKGPLNVNGLVRDYTHHPYTDSTGRNEGEDTFFQFPVTIE